MSSSRHPFHFFFFFCLRMPSIFSGDDCSCFRLHSLRRRIVDVIHCFVFRLLEKAAAGAAARSQKELNIDGTNSGVLLWLATNEMNTLF